METQAFREAVSRGFEFKGETFTLGSAILGGQSYPDLHVKVPMKTMNRHGLIAGATGTGKTKTLQVLAESLSDAGVPVLVMDIKGDLSGIGAEGEGGEKIAERSRRLGIEFKPAAYPVEMLTLSEQKGVRLRATVSEFGPVLLSRILGLNDTQGGFVAMIFKYCDDHKLPLLNLADFIKVLQYVSNEGKAELEKDYGKISTTSTGTILRKVIELQQQGADHFFGEISFDIDDLMRKAPDGRGMISILRVTDIQDRPKLFSTFMLQLLAELYATCPEEGDIDKPKLVMFFDEAHLIFDEASKTLLDQIETVIKLIRSKGIGVFFCTQNPMDVPPEVLAQLGMKIQHALRAFTAADRKVIRKTAENYPETDFYETDQLITQLGTGEALVVLLNEKGIPTPLVHCLVRTPNSRMDILSETEINSIISTSELVKKYEEEVDSESAHEILSEKLRNAPATEKKEKASPGRPRKEKSILDDPTIRSMTRTAGNTLVRTLLGVLGLGGRRR